MIPAFLALGLLTTIPSSTTDEAPPFRVAVYLPDYRMADFSPDGLQGVTDLILFSASPKADGQLDLSRLAKAPWARFKTFKSEQKARVTLAVGGWERSAAFAEVSASETKRAAFVKSAVEVCKQRDLDGLDLDWEHPKDSIEAANYALLLTDLRKAFEPLRLSLAITMAGWQPLPKAGFDAVDWVQIMAYDNKGKHATPESAEADVKKLIERGAAKDKIVLGLPFYGRGIIRPDETPTYSQIVAKHHPKPDVDEIDGVYFNGPKTIRRKTRFARESGLAGVMIWEIGQDVSGADSLLRSVVAESAGR